LLVAHPQILDVARAQPERRIRLRVDLKHAAELVELRDVRRPEIGREGGEHLVESDVQSLRLDPVYFDAQLRRQRAKRGGDELYRSLRLCICDHRVGGALQLGEIGAAVAELDLQGEAAGVANALDRRRREGGDTRIDGGERRRQAVEQGEKVFALASRA